VAEVRLTGKEQVMKRALDVLEARMVKACAFAVGYCKRSVSRGNVTGENPSAPGEPPKLRKGILASNIGYETIRSSNRVSGYIGVTKASKANEYALYLELGRGPIFPKTKKLLKFKIGNRWISKHSVGPMEERPFLRPTIINNRRKIIKILAPEK